MSRYVRVGFRDHWLVRSQKHCFLFQAQTRISGLHRIPAPNLAFCPLWIGDDKCFDNYLPLFASNKRILSVGLRGELILVDAQADSFKVVSRLRLFEDGPSNQTQLPGHPALINTRLFLRGENELVCAELVSAAR
jgi:hypothetical protein